MYKNILRHTNIPLWDTWLPLGKVGEYSQDPRELARWMGFWSNTFTSIQYPKPPTPKDKPTVINNNFTVIQRLVSHWSTTPKVEQRLKPLIQWLAPNLPSIKSSLRSICFPLFWQSHINFNEHLNNKN